MIEKIGFKEYAHIVALTPEQIKKSHELLGGSTMYVTKTSEEERQVRHNMVITLLGVYQHMESKDKYGKIKTATGLSIRQIRRIEKQSG